MKKSTKVTVAVVSVAATIALVGTGLSSAHESWRGGDGYQGQSYHGQHRKGGHHGKAHKKMLRMMKQFDSNGDSSLTQAEIDEGRQKQLAQYDSDKDGNLSLQEFQALWLDRTRSRMVDRFQNLDEDGDASVTTAEFMEPFANAVERHDRNGDGALSRDDRRKKGRRGDGKNAE